ncbi:MAG TPA: PIN domain-containing protein [Candidatus Sulfotelmatobacter sp.]
MSGRFFLDTNIFVYAFDPHAPAKARKSVALIKQAADSGSGIVSYQVVQEFFNVAFRRFSPAMTGAEAEEYLGTVFRPLLAVHSSPALYFAAMRIKAQRKLGWYDSLIVAAAVEGGCDILYSEDLQHGSTIDNVRIQNPFA